MYVTAEKGLLPSAMAKVNKNSVPVPLVVFQLFPITVVIVVFTNTGGGNNISFLIALALTVVLYLMTYFMFFVGYITLVLNHPERKRGYYVPGGKVVKLAVAASGLLISLLAFVVSFFPPSGLPGGESTESYIGLLLVSFLVVVLIPRHRLRVTR